MFLRTSLALLLVAVATVSVAGSKKFQPVGCYMSTVDNHVLNQRALQNSAMTHEMCRDTCYARTQAYFGLLGGDKCYCGEDMHEGVKVKGRMCNWRCGGNHKQGCGSDMGIRIFKIGAAEPVRQKVTSARLYKASDTVVLFSIKAHIGEMAIAKYMKKSSNLDFYSADLPRVLYRSGHLDHLSELIKSHRLQFIVAEMRSGGFVVSQVVFDVSYDVDKIGLLNWFSPDRLVSSFPYWVGKEGFAFFSIVGRSNTYTQQTFHILNFFNGCSGDTGFWTVVEKPMASLDCSWITVDTAKNGYPSLIYSKQPGTTFEKSAGYAEYLVIYGAVAE